MATVRTITDLLNAIPSLEKAINMSVARTPSSSSASQPTAHDDPDIAELRNCATPFRYDPRMRFVTPDRGLWPHADPRDLERWLTKVRQPDPPLGHGCILWIGAIETTSGYPRFQKGSGPDAEIVSAQRWSYQAATGIDPGDRVIRHDCDIRICEHPHHHQPGTVADNVADTVARGRHANTSFGAPGRWVRFSLRLRDAIRADDYTATAAMLATPEQLSFFNQPSTHAERP